MLLIFDFITYKITYICTRMYRDTYFVLLILHITLILSKEDFNGSQNVQFTMYCINEFRICSSITNAIVLHVLR